MGHPGHRARRRELCCRAARQPGQARADAAGDRIAPGAGARRPHAGNRRRGGGVRCRGARPHVQLAPTDRVRRRTGHRARRAADAGHGDRWPFRIADGRRGRAAAVPAADRSGCRAAVALDRVAGHAPAEQLAADEGARLRDHGAGRTSDRRPLERPGGRRRAPGGRGHRVGRRRADRPSRPSPRADGHPLPRAPGRRGGGRRQRLGLVVVRRIRRRIGFHDVRFDRSDHDGRRPGRRRGRSRCERDGAGRAHRFARRPARPATGEDRRAAPRLREHRVVGDARAARCGIDGGGPAGRERIAGGVGPVGLGADPVEPERRAGLGCGGRRDRVRRPALRRPLVPHRRRCRGAPGSGVRVGDVVRRSRRRPRPPALRDVAGALDRAPRPTRGVAGARPAGTRRVLPPAATPTLDWFDRQDGVAPRPGRPGRPVAAARRRPRTPGRAR